MSSSSSGSNSNKNSSLQESLSYFKDSVFDCIKSKKSISVTTHIDCDGLTSGSIITKALIRAGANCTVRTAKEFSRDVISELKDDSRDFHIISDFGGGFAKDLDEVLGDSSWVVLDHHQIDEDEYENERVINAWKFGIDGGKEICAGGMTYLAANAL
ncbi:MAG: single-stranded DNA exonuclease RecJ, partial [Aliifodinibius sp.]|nr:DHH family phosphoesterase [Fodinibius sp.]NIY28977.1 single-stranded DNA exonuclease RecJ [Fodinibius sp.]